MNKYLNINEATEEQLQAQAYRTLIQLDGLQKQLQAINNELSKRSKEKVEDNVSVLKEKIEKPKLVS
jgi:hypothetical protein